MVGFRPAASELLQVATRRTATRVRRASDARTLGDFGRPPPKRRQFSSRFRATASRSCASFATCSRSCSMRAAASMSLSARSRSGNWKINAIVPSCRIPGSHQPAARRVPPTRRNGSVAHARPEFNHRAGRTRPVARGPRILRFAPTMPNGPFPPWWGRSPASRGWHPLPSPRAQPHGRRIRRRARQPVHNKPAIFAGRPSKRVKQEFRIRHAGRARRVPQFLADRHSLNRHPHPSYP